MQTKVLLYSILVLISLSSCIKSLDFGDELLQNELVNVLETDTLRIVAKTEVNDSLVAFDTTSVPGRVIVGRIDDPVFGVTTAKAYLQFGLVVDSSTSIDQFISPSGVVDSVVLRLRYDTNAYYGTYLNGVNIEIREVLEDMSFGEHQANENLAVSGDVLGSTGLFTPTGEDYFVPEEPVTQDAEGTNFSSDTFKLVKSIKLSSQFAQRMRAYPASVYDTDESLREVFKGLELSASADSDGLFPFNMVVPGQMNIYYNYVDTNGIQRSDAVVLDVIAPCISSKSYDPSCVIFSSYENDHSQGFVSPFIDDTEMGDSLVFIQSTIGLNTILEFPTAMDLNGKSLAKAELILTVANIPGDNTEFFPPQDRLLLSYEEDGISRLIEDVAVIQFFDGQLTDVEDPDPRQIYSMNLTSHFQQIIEGKKPNKLVVSPNLRAFSAERVSIHGPGAQKYPLTLILAYTEN